jgi:hypothetical protein
MYCCDPAVGESVCVEEMAGTRATCNVHRQTDGVQ